jgi:ATP-binding cassette subfamily F protein 3
MIQLSGLTKSYGDRVLLDGVTWQLGDRDRVALCGPNGAGKTTLLKMLAGLEELDAGAIVKPSAMTVGYLPQDGLTHGGRTLLAEAQSAFQGLIDLKAELHALEERLGDAAVPEDEHERMLVRYAEAQEEFRRRDGYAIDLKVNHVLRGLGFGEDDLEKPTETFSGGWQMRIALSRLLLSGPDLLLLDEPTNHLDLEARNWLEEFLVDYPHAVILVSHDRYFLDTVSTRIAELNLRTLTDYPGNYTDYLRESQARMDRLRQAKKEQDEEIARVKLFIDRFRYKATKAAQVQSRIKALEKIVPIDVPPARKRVRFTFPACARSGRTVLRLEHVRKAYGDTVVFRDLSLLLERGDRVALIGPNGAGKSTLMRMLSGVDPPDTGTREEGHQVVMQYFAQDEATRLDPTRSVYETLADGSPMNMVPMIRTILGGFLFEGDDVHKKAGVLSGGERTRLAVARMLLRPSNTLLLDEPTNHLDLDSKDVLLEALEDFGGTLVLVSHDRYFIDRLATKVIEVGNGEALVYPGGYEEFRWSKAARAGGGNGGGTVRTVVRPPAAAAPKGGAAQPPRARAQSGAAAGGNGQKPGQAGAVPKPDGIAAAPAEAAAGAREREEKKRLEAEARRRKRAADAIQTKVGDLESRIAEREGEMKRLEAEMSDPAFYADKDASRQAADRHQALMWELGDLMHQWEELQQQLQGLP